MPRWWPIGSCDARVRGRVSNHSLENPPLLLHSRSKVCGCDCDLVAELAKRLRQPPGVSHLGLGIRFDAVLYKPHPLMQDLPHHTAEPMGDGPDGGLIAQPGQQTPEHHLKVPAFPLARSVRRLVQHPPQILLPLAERLLWFC